MNNLIGYLSDSTKSFLNDIYKLKQSFDRNEKSDNEDNLNISQSIWVCKVIFESLTTLSKHYIVRSMFLNKIINDSDLQAMLKPDRLKVHNDSINELIRLHIFTIINESKVGNDRQYETNSNFFDSLKLYIYKPIEPFTVISFDTTNTITLNDIHHNSIEKWNNLLHFLVGTPDYLSITTRKRKMDHFIYSNEKNTIETFVLTFQLMNRLRKESKNLTITAKGYEYILKDHYQQVWEFITFVLGQVTEQADGIVFMCMLSCGQVGSCYSSRYITTTQRQILIMLSHVGLVYIAHHSDDDIHFYNTNTMMNLLSHTSLPSSSSSLSEKSSSLSRVIPITHETTLSSSSLQIVVETNMQVIAYLTNDLHISILNLFIEVILRMPNMIIGRITRDKVKKAYKIGLSSDQIIHFLVSHSHPIVKSKSNDTSQLSHDFLVIPENVIDQLKLWEAENHRIISNDAIVFCFNDIPNLSSSQYHDIITYMKRFESYILYMNESQRILAVTLDGAEQLQSYVQETMSGYIF